MEYSHEIIVPNDDLPLKCSYLREVEEDISARNTGTDQ